MSEPEITDEMPMSEERLLELFWAVVRAAQEIDREGYVESMQNVPSWQRLAQALEALRVSKPTEDLRSDLANGSGKGWQTVRGRDLDEAVSDTEITDEMVRLGKLAFANALIDTPAPPDDPDSNGSAEERWFTAVTEAVLTAALPHSPLLAEIKALKEERDEARSDYNDAFALNMALKEENRKLRQSLRVMNSCAQSLMRDPVPECPACDLPRHHEGPCIDPITLAAPTQGENE